MPLSNGDSTCTSCPCELHADLWYNPETRIIMTLGVNQASVDPNELATALFDAALVSIGS